MKKLASEVLRDLQIRVARLEKSSAYHMPSINESLDPVEVGMTIEKGHSGIDVRQRHYGSRYVSVLELRSLRRFKAGQEIDDRAINTLIKELYSGSEYTLMVSEFVANKFDPRMERQISKRSDEMYWGEASDLLRKASRRGKLIMGSQGFFVIVGRNGYFFY
jgi:hypothetical protein